MLLLHLAHKKLTGFAVATSDASDSDLAGSTRFHCVLIGLLRLSSGVRYDTGSVSEKILVI